jgi:hypothetical protein
MPLCRRYLTKFFLLPACRDNTFFRLGNRPKPNALHVIRPQEIEELAICLRSALQMKWPQPSSLRPTGKVAFLKLATELTREKWDTFLMTWDRTAAQHNLWIANALY